MLRSPGIALRDYFGEEHPFTAKKTLHEITETKAPTITDLELTLIFHPFSKSLLNASPSIEASL